MPLIDYGMLDDLVGYAVRRAQIVIYEDFARAVGDLGMTPQRYAALTLIGANPNLSQTELGEILGVARSGSMVLINALHDLGLIECVPRPNDKRTQSITLSAAGVTALDGISRRVMAHDQRMSAALSEDERMQLVSLLGLLGGQAVKPVRASGQD